MEGIIDTRYKKYVKRENKYLKKLLKKEDNKKRYEVICKKAEERKTVLKKQGYFENHKVESLEEAKKIVEEFYKFAQKYVADKKASKKKGILHNKKNIESIGCSSELMDPMTMKDLRAFMIEYDSNIFKDDELEDIIDKAYITIKDVDPAEIRLTIIVALYIGMKISPEQFYKYVDANNFIVEIEFINSVFKFMQGVPFNPNYNTYMINEAYDSVEDLQKILTFMYESDVFNNSDDNMSDLLIETRERLEHFMREELRSNEGKQDVEVATPVRFINKNLEFTDAAGTGVTRGMLNKLEKEFGGLLAPYTGSYRFDKYGDMFVLSIFTNDRMDQYEIDPGLVIGDGYQLIHVQGGFTRFIKIEEGNADIISNILADRNYKMSETELLRCDMNKFMNQMIYRDIDMSKGPEIFPKLTPEEKNILGKKFTFILNLPWASTPEETETRFVYGRCRIRNFKSINDFTLVSDSKVKVPMNICRYNISDGLTIKVINDTVTVMDKNTGKKEEYTIEKYNEM